MPRVHGNSCIHVSEIDHIVEVDLPIYELDKKKMTEVEERIGRNVAELIDDESCLQLGIGGSRMRSWRTAAALRTWGSTPK